MITDREPVAQRINSMITTLDDLVKMACDPATRDEVAAEVETGLGEIKLRIDLILSRFIQLEAHKPHKHRNSGPGIRIVK